MHLYLELSVTLARFAAPTAHIEREAPGAVAARPGFGCRGEQRADIIPQAHIGGGVGSGRAAYGRLVDVMGMCVMGTRTRERGIAHCHARHSLGTADCLTLPITVSREEAESLVV